MIRRKYEFTEDKKVVDEQDSLMHYGRKGMKWYKNIFADTADRLGKAAENLKNDKKYDVSQETKDIAAGKYGKKEDGKTDDSKESTTKVGGASGGVTEKKEKKEEKSELEKLKEENEKLKQQLAQQTTTTTTTHPAQQQAQPQPQQQQSSPAIKAKPYGDPISDEKEAAKNATGISATAKPIKVPSSVVNNISDAQAEALKKVGIEVKRDSDNTTKETQDSNTNNTTQNDKNTSKKLEDTINKTNELSNQLKRSEERITLLEELLKKYEKR